MKRSQLPLKGLSVLEVAARHLSFTGAAQELKVTPDAVRKRIGALEQQLGVILIRRTEDGFELTNEAVSGLSALKEALKKLGHAVEAIESFTAPKPNSAENRFMRQSSNSAIQIFLEHN